VRIMRRIAVGFAADGRRSAAGTAVARPLPLRALPLALRSPTLPLSLRAGSRWPHPRRGQHGSDLLRRKLERLPPLDARRHGDGAVTGANQATHREAKRFEQAPELAIASFLDHDVVPMIGAFAAAILELLDLCRSVIELDARCERSLLLGRERAHHPDRVLALDLVARMHHLVRELARVREQQQPFGIEIESPDRDPLAVADVGKLLEHRRTTFGIVARDDLAGRLVIHENARARFGEADPDELAVDSHFVAGSDFLSDLGRLAVYGV